jgi:pyridoxal phosphate enzyme (YggS family)
MSDAIDAGALTDVRAAVEAVRGRIEAACRRVGRDPAEVTLVGACKRQPLARIAAAVLAGVDSLGENYVQEARDIQGPLIELLSRSDARFRDADAAPPAPRWRMIGHLQTNKARHAVGLFGAIDTLDRAKLARELDKRAGALGTSLEACIQVNLSEEPQKAGIEASAVPDLLAACADLEHLRVVGLMTIPAAASDPEQSRPTFARLRALRDTLSALSGHHALRELNMGMSGDFEIAIEEGATLVRVGTALFGERASKPT